jgi:hypothetical protein
MTYPGRRVLGGAIFAAVLVVSSAWAAHADAIGFSHAVVVDQQRPGFEPDVKVDGNGVVYTSVPFGFSRWTACGRARA